MELRNCFSSLVLFFVVSLLLQKPIYAAKKSYIVYLGGHPQIPEDVTHFVAEERRKEAHYELLGTVLGSAKAAQDAIFYSYTKHINGFAATLEDEEANQISKRAGVLSVIPDVSYKLHTTRTWDFLGLKDTGNSYGSLLWKKARYGEDTIIANIDSGVWPESESFNDKGMGPIPSRWKGGCDKGFPCNKKLIGAKHFQGGLLASRGILDDEKDPARDYGGHGTHTLSTAGGNFVANASLFNIAKGTAKGGSPSARVASYKACNSAGQCQGSDVLGGFEAAISDGVDVISVSLGIPPVDYLSDPIAVGSFHAMKQGIAVICSAGNDGPNAGSVSNVAPWILTVGASTVDRDYTTSLVLGNKKQIVGQSFSEGGINGFKPIFLAEDVKADNSSKQDARLCVHGTLDPEKVKNKIVVCNEGIISGIKKSKTVRDAGGAGMVIASVVERGTQVMSLPYLLPAVQISKDDALVLFSYLNSTNSPNGYITSPTTLVGIKPAPRMAYFSSQGPNRVTPGILKPDITAPGFEILAAFSQAAPLIEKDPEDTRRVAFNIVSGTSMSCPHVAGVVGLFKTLYPDWSPSAIRSALMTTAMTHDNRRDPILGSQEADATPFDYGSGHLNPTGAMYPGLVYDLNVTDYLNFLCARGYNSDQIGGFNNNTYSCPSKAIDVKNLNYPSIAVPNLKGSVTVERTVKNVGTSGTYHVQIFEPQGISVSIKPDTLEFKNVGEEKKFEVTLTDKSNGTSNGTSVFGKFVWSDGKHFVGSPIAVFTPLAPFLPPSLGLKL